MIVCNIIIITLIFHTIIKFSIQYHQLYYFPILLIECLCNSITYISMATNVQPPMFSHHSSPTALNYFILYLLFLIDMQTLLQVFLYCYYAYFGVNIIDRYFNSVYAVLRGLVCYDVVYVVSSGKFEHQQWPKVFLSVIIL